ncbi:hypothetical protein NDU88_000134 [Pleurodeles waltl]|uniref:Uncharacterized protein n=1 Tax=Pleurodeles waltl TaxID=8319 RepID=A0AAV7L8U4_PLEWA|nr:hypothetical protein NDU88_000134 [Pleurodeles waltl]
MVSRHQWGSVRGRPVLSTRAALCWESRPSPAQACGLNRPAPPPVPPHRAPCLLGRPALPGAGGGWVFYHQRGLGTDVRTAAPAPCPPARIPHPNLNHVGLRREREAERGRERESAGKLAGTRNKAGNRQQQPAPGTRHLLHRGVRDHCTCCTLPPRHPATAPAVSRQQDILDQTTPTSQHQAFLHPSSKEPEIPAARRPATQLLLPPNTKHPPS